MAQLPQSTFSEEGLHRGNTCAFKYGTVGNLIRPRNRQDAAKASRVKGVQALLLPNIDGPGLAAIK